MSMPFVHQWHIFFLAIKTNKLAHTQFFFFNICCLMYFESVQATFCKYVIQYVLYII
jgi:hypothetical protein